MNQFKSEFDLPELTDEVAAKLRHILYFFIDLFEANYYQKIKRYERKLQDDTEAKSK